MRGEHGRPAALHTHTHSLQDIVVPEGVVKDWKRRQQTLKGRGGGDRVPNASAADEKAAGGVEDSKALLLLRTAADPMSRRSKAAAAAACQRQPSITGRHLRRIKKLAPTDERGMWLLNNLLAQSRTEDHEEILHVVYDRLSKRQDSLARLKDRRKLECDRRCVFTKAANQVRTGSRMYAEAVRFNTLTAVIKDLHHLKVRRRRRQEAATAAAATASVAAAAATDSEGSIAPTTNMVAKGARKSSPLAQRNKVCRPRPSRREMKKAVDESEMQRASAATTPPTPVSSSVHAKKGQQSAAQSIPAPPDQGRLDNSKHHLLTPFVGKSLDSEESLRTVGNRSAAPVARGERRWRATAGALQTALPPLEQRYGAGVVDSWASSPVALKLTRPRRQSAMLATLSREAYVEYMRSTCAPASRSHHRKEPTVPFQSVEGGHRQGDIIRGCSTNSLLEQDQEESMNLSQNAGDFRVLAQSDELVQNLRDNQHDSDGGEPESDRAYCSPLHCGSKAGCSFRSQATPGIPGGGACVATRARDLRRDCSGRHLRLDRDSDGGSKPYDGGNSVTGAYRRRDIDKDAITQSSHQTLASHTDSTSFAGPSRHAQSQLKIIPKSFSERKSNGLPNVFVLPTEQTSSIGDSVDAEASTIKIDTHNKQEVLHKSNSRRAPYHAGSGDMHDGISLNDEESSTSFNTLASTTSAFRSMGARKVFKQTQRLLEALRTPLRSSLPLSGTDKYPSADIGKGRDDHGGKIGGHSAIIMPHRTGLGKGLASGSSAGEADPSVHFLRDARMWREPTKASDKLGRLAEVFRCVGPPHTLRIESEFAVVDAMRNGHEDGALRRGAWGAVGGAVSDSGMVSGAAMDESRGGVWDDLVSAWETLGDGILAGRALSVFWQAQNASRERGTPATNARSSRATDDLLPGGLMRALLSTGCYRPPGLEQLFIEWLDELLEIVRAYVRRGCARLPAQYDLRAGASWFYEVWDDLSFGRPQGQHPMVKHTALVSV